MYIFDMDQKIAILVLCGLPAVGKTTFARNLQNHLLTFASHAHKKCKQTAVRYTWDRIDSEAGISEAGDSVKYSCVTCEHVCYDDIIPTNLYRSNIIDKETELDGNPEAEPEVSSWKGYRRQICSCVEQDIRNCESPHNIMQLQIAEDVIEKFSTKKTMSAKLSDSGQAVKIIIIDDNMFLRSMRYEYFQLAKKYSTGFAEVFLNCSIEDVHHRNRSRGTTVSDESIANIASKFEKPDALNHHWEKLSMELESTTCCQDEILQEVCSMIFHALTHPVEIDEIDDEARCMSRIVCSKNVLHQADHIMRKLIGLQMTKLKDEKCAINEDFKHKATHLNKTRTDLLDEMKSSKWLIPSDLELHTTDAAKDCDNPLFLHVKVVFDTRVHDV